jgi:signal transduction histidine kinase/CheY-like chemotaxis protein
MAPGSLSSPRADAPAASATAGTADDVILAEQIRFAYGMRPAVVPWTVAPNLGVALILVTVMWGEVNRVLLLGWLLAEIVYQSARVLVARRYWQDADNRANARYWGRSFAVMATINATIWGSAGLLFFTPSSPLRVDALTVILCGMAAGAVVVNAILPAALNISLTMMVGFLALRFAAEGTAMSWTVAGLLVLYVAFLLGTGRQLCRMLTESIRRRYENEDLMHQLRLRTASLTQSEDAAIKASEAKSSLLAAASHDLRQPLHALGLFATKLSRQPAGADVGKVARGIEQSVRALHSMLNTLLDVSRLDAGLVVTERHAFPVNALLGRMREVYAANAAEKGLLLMARSSQLVVYSDPALLETVVSNFCANAVRYTSSGGVIVGCRQRGTTARITVWDTGIGIPADSLEEIFKDRVRLANAGRQDQTKGLGLGLALCRRISDLTGHPIGVRSRLGRGSTFWIDVPLVFPKATAVTTLAVQGDSSSTGCVALIERSEIVMGVLAELLQSWGLVVAAGISGSIVLDECHRNGLVPDVLICDVSHDGSADGVRVAARMRQEFPGLQVIMVSADGGEPLKSLAASHGWQFLRKPVQPARLRAHLNLLLSRAGAAP